jgi:hypothetical protein
MSGNVSVDGKVPGALRGPTLIFFLAHVPGSRNDRLPDHALATASRRKQRPAACFGILHELAKVKFETARFSKLFRPDRRSIAGRLFAGDVMGPKGKYRLQIGHKDCSPRR